MKDDQISRLATLGLRAIDQQRRLERDHPAFEFLAGTFEAILKAAADVGLPAEHMA